MLETAINGATKFHKDEKGSVAILFGLTIVSMSLMAGLAFDYGRGSASKAKVVAAVDAAALAAAKAVRLEGLDETEATELAKKVFEQNMLLTSAKWTDVHSFTVTFDKKTSKAIVDVKASVPTTLGRIAGVTELETNATATALFESRDVEVSLQLDLTGSMCSPCSKLSALKEATKDLLDILIPKTKTAQKVRVALAPFSAGVNAGPYLRKVNGDRWSANNCVYERKTSTNVLSDAKPVDDDAYMIKADLTGAVQDCPSAPVVPLTDDREMLKKTVDKYKAISSTAGQLGTAWAWNMISPNWKTIWPSESEPVEYGDKNTDKVAILMTDGVYNTIGGVWYGDTSSQAVAASNLSVDICTKMKAEGIIVYTVGFDLDSIPDIGARDRATTTLKSCAGRSGPYDPADYFYKAENEKDLRTAFSNIATSIMRLRLTN